MSAGHSLEELRQKHIIHELNEPVIRHNFNGLIAKILRQETKCWISRVFGKRILEVGAGFGALTRILNQAGYEVTPMDIDPDSIRLAGELAGVKIESQSIYDLEKSKAFDAALFRDVVSHLETEKWIAKIKELNIPQVIVIDSNLENALLRWSRHRIGHEEHDEQPLSVYVQSLEKAGFKLIKKEYSGFLAWPLSGGFLVKQILPRWDFLERLCLLGDISLGVVMNGLGVGRWFGWRYILVFKRASDAERNL